MTQAARPTRSVLYIPGSNARAMQKARTLGADAIIFDLEDAVAPDEKPGARDAVAAALGEGGYAPRLTLVRINGLDTPWGGADLDAAAGMVADAVLLPKAEDAEVSAEVARRLEARGSDARVWAMMETPMGVLNAPNIAQAPRMAGFVMGTNDLAVALGSRTGGDRAPLMTALQACLLAARAAGIACVDGVYNAFRDADGLEAECRQGRDLGMDGKTLIHPAQIEVANRVFAPDEDEVDLARRRIEAHAEAEAKGQGVAVLDGQIVENLHVGQARMTLARAEAAKATER